MHPLSYLSIGLGVVLLSAMTPTNPQDQKPAGGRYIGSAMCKNCHNGADKGNTYDHWTETPHAKAFESLATPTAKAVAKEKGIDDPQKSADCLKCHVTAYGVDPKLVKASFKPELGVQCESCHGPGETHQKKRMQEAMKKGAEPSPVTADEIVAGTRDAAACKKCHNEQSPTYKPFCLSERMKTIEHLDPRKKRSDEELAKLRATCEPDCKFCAEKKAGDGK